MSDSFDARSDPKPDARPSSGQRLPLVIAALLLLCTLGVGLAARERRPGTSIDPGGSAGTATGAQHAGGARAESGPVAMQVQLDRGSVLAGGDGLVRVELSLEGRGAEAALAPRRPTDFVVVLDRSGSMQGAPIGLAKAAVGELIEGLGADDRLSLVSYSNAARVDISLEAAGAEPAHSGPVARWSAVRERIAAGGGTNLSSGLDLAHQLVASSAPAMRRDRVARVILLSDGHANQGDHSLEGLRARAGRAVAAEYVISAVGLGDGFDESVMSSIADAGTGNFYYLPDVRRLASIFQDELASARETVASSLRFEFRPQPGVELRDAGGYPLMRTSGDAGDVIAFHPGALFSGQRRRLWLTLRAPTQVVGPLALGGLHLSYTDSGGAHHRLELPSLPTVSCVEREVDYYASFDEDVYRRSGSEVVGALKRRVAAQLREGERDAAVANVEATLRALEQDQQRALGYVVPSERATLESLQDALSAPEAARAAVQNTLGKRLLEEGRDDSRIGAKR